MLNNGVCRATTDKQTHKQTSTQTHKHTYRVKTEETFLPWIFFLLLFSFKKAVSNMHFVRFHRFATNYRLIMLTRICLTLYSGTIHLDTSAYCKAKNSERRQAFLRLRWTCDISQTSISLHITSLHFTSNLSLAHFSELENLSTCTLCISIGILSFNASQCRLKLHGCQLQYVWLFLSCNPT